MVGPRSVPCRASIFAHQGPEKGHHRPRPKELPNVAPLRNVTSLGRETLMLCSKKEQTRRSWNSTMAPEPKRKKADDDQPLSRGVIDSVKAEKTKQEASFSSSKVSAAQTSGVDYQRIQEAKNFAVAEAQRECCTGSYRIFDSLYGNFLIPVIPTLADFAD